MTCACIGYFANEAYFAVNQLADKFRVKEFGSADVGEFELTLLRKADGLRW